MSENKTEKVSLNIFGSQINLHAPEGDREYVEQLGAYVNDQMLKVSEQASAASITKVAFLVCLNIADEYFTEKRSYDALKKHLSEITDPKTEEIKKFLKKTKK